jgi:small subunit ribosomal protein S21
MSRNKHGKNETLPSKKGLTVTVRNNDIESALKVLKRRMTQEGVIKDLKKHEFFETGTAKRRRKMAEARRRWLKKQSQTAQF